jgi:hypothetical protein
MKEQKNIDRLFQEKFKDFEVAPPEMAWKNIESKLNKKEKKRRIIPFWFKPTGIAASLLVGFYTLMLFNENSKAESDKKKNSIEFNKDSKNNSSKINQNNESLLVPNNSTVTTNESLNGNNTIDSGVFSNESNTAKESNNVAIKSTNNRNLNSAVIVSNSYNNDSQNKNKEENLVLKDAFLNQIKSNKQEVESELKNSTLAKNEIKSDVKNNLIQIKNNSNRSVVILEKSNADITQDSSIVAKISEEVSALEQLLKEKEVGKNAEEKEKRNKWGVSTNVAPVYFNSSTNGSPIDTHFSENSKSYVSTLSYGAGINYDISKKLNLRAGINSLALEYNTNDVLYTTSYKNNATKGEESLSRNANGQNIAFIDQNKSVFKSISADMDDVIVQEKRGTLNQTTNYIEVPLEIGYKIIDNKFGIELIGGMSSLFLNNNSISLLSNGMEMEIGKANNLNKVHFSSNVGLGFKYRFLKSFEANFNPMLKYQMNTYTNNSGNFKPYFIGLYSGLSFKF